jgi:membrane protein DedA with SNARE-associated domain
VMGGPLADVAQWITDAVYAFGYVGVFVLTFLGNLHLPVPTQLTLPLSGYLVWEGRFSFAAVMVASTAAAVAVSFVFYYLGACVSEENLRRFVVRYGRFAFVRESDLDKAGRKFERHGGKAILLGHLVPGIGAFISIPAGIKRMPIRWRFLFYTVLGSILYNVAHVGLGWALGSHWTLVEQYEPIVKYVVLAALAGGIIFFVWRRWRDRG